MSRSFNGTNYLGYAGAVRTALPVTFAGWVYRPTGASGTIIALTTNTLSNAISLVALSTGAVRARSSTAGGTVANANTIVGISNNTWGHAASVFTSTTSRTAYINGGNPATNTATNDPNASSFNKTNIGARNSNLAASYTGYIADAGVWSVALTAAEIASLATGVSPLSIRPESLIAYWPLMGRTDPEIDLRGRYEMTVNGAVAADHPRVYMPVGTLLNSRARRNLTLVATDVNDTANLQATVTSAPANLAISATEGYTDAASLQATVTAVARNAALVATDPSDSASLVIKVPVNATLAGTDINDSASMNASVLVSSILVATETVDAASLQASVTVKATLNATDLPDSAALACSVPINAYMSATEASDSAYLLVDTGAAPGAGLQPLLGMMANTGTLLLRH